MLVSVLRASAAETKSKMSVRVYYTTVAGSREVKSQQSEVTRVMDSKGIKYEMIDIAQNNSLKEEMRTKSGNPNALPPQIFNGEQHCGGYEDFVEAVETSDVRKFLKLD
ncbi:SH3 domain-binding glutamic acid-rich-like protein 3 isoform X1 [Carcharodon carcharias]|uniref:SH3 domain-binding glutamic acid-rich-like protein 3 isoform X1 n=1 Tax=Carcharodon carcharias TaxID=13397 RepID=UPI001B7E4E76|nr:SH3 domain-binding glutamic acid-rich-like protein 3 isoform X1 [Carcharodon carcharias]